MNEDLISRSALRAEIESYVMPILTNNLMGASDAYYRILHLLDGAPAVDAETVFEQIGLVKEAFEMAKAYLRPVRHGRWVHVKTYYDADECNCSLCGQLMTTKTGNRMNYCPNCGAKMDGGSLNGTNFSAIATIMCALLAGVTTPLLNTTTAPTAVRR